MKVLNATCCSNLLSKSKIEKEQDDFYENGGYGSNVTSVANNIHINQPSPFYDYEKVIEEHRDRLFPASRMNLVPPVPPEHEVLFIGGRPKDLPLTEKTKTETNNFYNHSNNFSYFFSLGCGNCRIWVTARTCQAIFVLFTAICVIATAVYVPIVLTQQDINWDFGWTNWTFLNGNDTILGSTVVTPISVGGDHGDKSDDENPYDYSDYSDATIPDFYDQGGDDHQNLDICGGWVDSFF